MNKIEVDRVVAAKYAFEEAMNAAFYGSHDRLSETSICLPTMRELRRISEAVGILPAGASFDDEGAPLIYEVTYGGCRFWTSATDVEVTYGL